jgi:hypothetical protein
MNITFSAPGQYEAYPLSLRGLAALKVRASILSTSQTKRARFETAVHLLRVCLFVCEFVWGCVGLLEIAASRYVYCFNNIL